jgi:hypothetical protein
MQRAHDALNINKIETDESMKDQLDTLGDEIDQTQLALQTAMSSTADAHQQKTDLLETLHTAELKENELYVTIRKYDDTFTGQVSKRSCTH